MQKRRRASRRPIALVLALLGCESHPDAEIVSSAPSQPVVPLVELSSDDEIEKPHESDNDDEEESGSFE